MSLLPNENSRRLGLIPKAFYLGFISLSLQIVYARLAVSFSGGNEIYLSLFFLFWLIFTGLGALLIKKISIGLLYAILGVLAIAAPGIFYLAPRLFKLLPGQIVPPQIYIITIALALLPVCFIDGALFSSIAFKISGENKSGQTYWSEALGSLLGGTAVTVFYFAGGRDYSYLLFLALLCLTFVQLRNRVAKVAVLAASLLILIAGIGEYMEVPLLKYHYLPYDYSGSASGRLVRYDAVKTGEITTLFSGGVKVADFPDYITSQELFYWPYLAKPNLHRVALIGAEMNWVDRVMPDSVERAYIFPDRSWRKLVDSEYLPSLENSVIMDPVKYLDTNKRKYDVIILNLGQLLSLHDKRLETDHFFGLCRENLKTDGLLSINVDSYEGMWRDDLRYRLRGIYQILNEKFGNVSVIPGERLTFLAGVDANKGIDDFIDNYQRLQIDSPYFNMSLIRARLNSFNVNRVLSQLEVEKVAKNRYAIGFGLSYYFSKFGSGLGIMKFLSPASVVIILFLVILLSIFLAGFNSEKSFLLAGITYFGMASFIFELMAMYRIQLLGGYLYMALGIVVGLFMLGMAAGSFAGARFTNRSNLPNNVYRGVFIAATAFVVLAGLFLLTGDSEFVLLIITALAGFAGGFGFAVSTRVFDIRPGLPYGMDLMGGTIGTIVGLSVLLNTLNSAVVLAAICGLALILMATNKAVLKY